MKTIAWFTCFIFAFTSAASGQTVLPFSTHSEVSNSAEVRPLEKITVPEELGTLQSEYYHSEKSPFVVFIQDAHAVVDAQVRIQDLVGYFSKEYGIRLVALEGGEGELDPTLIRNFPDADIKQKVMREYLDRGEVTGSEMAAVLNSPEISYFGIEDWKLYETHYRAYLAAERERGPLLEALAGKEAELDREREAVYSVPHNEFHGKVKAFREERLPLLDFLKYLQLTTCDLGLMTDEKYPHLKTLLNSIERDSGIDYEMLDGEIRELCERFRAEYGKRLTAEQAAAFNGRCQEFMTGRGSAAGFLRYLTGLPGEIGAELELSPSMKSLLSHEELLCSIKGTQVFEELEALIEEAEERLSANAEEKALVGKYARLGLLRDMAKLELNREKFERYQASPGEYLELVPDEKMLAGHLEFYRCAAARDEVLQKNLETLMNREKREAAIVILGGFHRSGFEKRLKANGYSFCTITPKIDGLAGAENYDPVMQGNLSYAADLETTLYDAFMRHASLRLVSGLNEPDFRKSLKLWRDRLMMRLSEEGRIAQAAQYTRYVDFLIPEYARKFGRGNSHAPGGADLREAVGVYCDRFKSDVMKRIREEFLSRFGGILPKLTPGDAEVDPEAEGKINPKTRSEDISPSALGISLRNFISGAEAGGFAATVPSGARLIEVSGQEKAASLGETFEFGGRHGEASARGRGVFDIETNGNLVTITDVTPGAAHAGQALTFDPALFRDGQNVRVVANPRSGGAQPERANAALFPYFTVGLGDSFRWLFSIQEWRKKWGGERYISVVLFDTPENRYVAENILNDTADEFIFVKPQFPLVPQGQTRVSGDAYWGRNVHRVAWELLVRDLVERDPAFSEVYGFDTALPRLKTREGVEERFGPFIFHETEQTDEVFRWENNPDTEAAAERFYRARGINPGEDLIVGISMRLNLNGFESFRDTDIRQTLEVIKYLREHYGTERTGKRLVVLLFANGIEPYRTQVETRIGELRRRIRREQYSAKRIRETIETERALIEERLGERARLEAEIERRKKAEGEIPEDEWNELVKRIKEIDDGNKKSNEKISEDSRHLKNAEDRIQFLKEAVRELRTRLRLFGELQNLIDEARDEEGAFRVVDFTNAWDPDKNRDLDRAYSVPEQAAILSGIDLAIGVNSGGLDMALAVGCPGVRIGEFHDQIDFNRFLHASGDGPTISVIGKDPDESTWQKLFAGDEAVRPFRSSSDKSVMEAIRHVMEFLMTGERERASYRVQGSDMFEVNTEKMAESWNLDGSPGPDLETEHPALNSFLNAFSRNGLTGFLSAWTCRGPPESPLIRIPVICRKADQIIEFNMVYGGSKIPSLRRGPEEISPVNVFLLDPSFDVSQWGADELGALSEYAIVVVFSRQQYAFLMDKVGRQKMLKFFPDEGDSLPAGTDYRFWDEMFKGVKKGKSMQEGFLGHLHRIAQNVLNNAAEREKFRRLQRIIEKAWGGRSVDEIEPFSVGGYGSDLYKAHLNMIVRNLKDDFDEIDRFFSELAARPELWSAFFDIPQDQLGRFLGRSFKREEDPGRRRELLITALAERAGPGTVATADSLGRAAEALPVSGGMESAALSVSELETCRILFGEDFDPATAGKFLAANGGDGNLLLDQILIPAMTERMREIRADVERGLAEVEEITGDRPDAAPEERVFSEAFDEGLNSIRDTLADNGIALRESDAVVAGLRREIRTAAMRAADVPEEMTDSILTQGAADVDRAKVEEFSVRLNEAIDGLSREAAGGMVLVTDLPDREEDEEALLEALSKFPGRVGRLELVLQRGQSINRNRWAFPGMITQRMNRRKPEEVLKRILAREASEKGLGFLFTSSGISPEFRREINSIFTEVGKIGSKEMKDLALAATLLLLFKLSRLTPKERGRVTERTEVLNAYLEDAGLGFLKGRFGANGGSLELLAGDFVQSFAAEQAVERAA